VVAAFFERVTAHDWTALAEVLATDVERVGPFGDRVAGRERYLAFLEGTVPDRYGHDVHGVVPSPDGRRACARVTEHLTYPERELHLEEVLWFDLDGRGRIGRIEVFWQTPQDDPGGFGSALSEESYAGDGSAGSGPAGGGSSST
jgi:hypothetical protein